jgi:two-component system, NarL family, response regulator NreC
MLAGVTRMESNTKTDVQRDYDTTLANRGPAPSLGKESLRIALVTGEPVFRLGMRTLLEAAGDIVLCAEAAEARASFAAIEATKPAVVVMDVALQGMSGTSATREIKRRLPDARVLLLAAWLRERDVLEGFASGATGFALKSEPVEALLYAIRAVGQGKTYLSAEARGIARELAGRVAPKRAAALAGDVLAALSVREREVLDLVVRGWSNRDMARELCVSVKTIDTHRTRINRKLRCRSAADIVRFAADNGLLRRAPSAGGAEPPLGDSSSQAA